MAPTPAAVWVASVENGYVDGRLTRIDRRTHAVRVVWHRRDAAVQEVAAGGGDGVWALIGAHGPAEVARFDADGRLAFVRRVPGAGRIAADARGCWLSTNGALLHVDPSGHVRRIVAAPFGDVATGGDGAWLARFTSVLRIDERTGRVRTLVTGRLRGGGFQHDLAVGDGALWTLDEGTVESTSTVVRRNLVRGRATGRARVPGIADAVVVTPQAVWIATVAGRPGRPTYALVRLDPRTLRRTLLVRVG